MRTLALFSLSLVLLNCQPTGKKVMALVQDGSGKLAPTEVELTTASTAVNLKGTAAQLVGGAHIVIGDPTRSTLSGTDEQIALALLRDPGGDVRANYIEKNKVLWPADFHSWNMATTYFNFEQSLSYYRGIYGSQPTSDLESPKVYYWGTFEDLTLPPQQQQLRDNTIYYPLIKGFVLAPFYSCPNAASDASCGCPTGAACFQKIPLPMNLGIIGHEMAHRVFAQKVGRNAALPTYLGWPRPGANVLKSLDEGLADFHGYGVTCAARPGPGCTPNYLRLSVSEAQASPRDFTAPSRCMTAELRNAITNLDPVPYAGSVHLYALGTLFASALYQAGAKTGKTQLLQQALVLAYDDTSASSPGYAQLVSTFNNSSASFTPELAADTILSHISDPDLRRVACNELWDRLDLNCDSDNTAPCDNIPACPTTSIRGTSCPDLP